MDEERIDRLARRVGGRFKLASLVMKRMVDVNRGSQPLVEPDPDSELRTVLKEVDLDLIRLVPGLAAPQEPDDGGDFMQED